MFCPKCDNISTESVNHLGSKYKEIDTTYFGIYNITNQITVHFHHFFHCHHVLHRSQDKFITLLLKLWDISIPDLELNSLYFCFNFISGLLRRIFIEKFVYLTMYFNLFQFLCTLIEQLEYLLLASLFIFF